MSKQSTRIINKIDVWNDTVTQCNDGKLAGLEVIPSIKIRSLVVATYPRYPDTQIYVLNMDSADAAIDCVRKGYRPLLLNMADDQTPGGLVDVGNPAQEECLFRRSNYFKTLTKEFYPLENTDIVFSPQVCFFKDNDESEYQEYQTGVGVDCIACPAIRNPKIDIRTVVDEEPESFFEEIDMRDLMKEKARMIFQVGYAYGHDVLVLGAHGCGSWNGPANEIADIYYELLDEYKGCFRAVIFAISGLKSEGNYTIFMKRFT